MKNENPINDLLQRLDPSETALLDWLVPHLDDSHLREIAALDGGGMAAEFYQALKPIYERQPLPVPLTWMPRAVLELGRWSRPEAPQKYIARPYSKGTQGHLIRTFCCAVLLRAADDPETQGRLAYESDTLILLVDSVLRFGEEASESALRFLCWRVLRLSEDFEEFPFFLMALLLLYVALYQRGQNSSGLNLLIDGVLAEETRARARLAYILDAYDSEEWLLGLSGLSSCNEDWRILAQALLLDPVKGFPRPIAAKLRDIVKRLSG